MHPTITRLLWQELRGRRGQFDLGMAWWGTALLGGFFFRDGWEAITDFALALPYISLMPIVVAVGTAQRKPSEPVAAGPTTTPTEARRQGWSRLAGGWVALIAPPAFAFAAIALSKGFWWLVLPGRGYAWQTPVSQEMLSLGIGFAAIVWPSTSLYLLASLLGTWVRTEFGLIFAGLGAAVLVALLILGQFAPYPLYRISPVLAIFASAIAPNILEMFPYLFRLGISVFKVVFGPVSLFALVVPLLINALLQFAAAAYFVHRHGQRCPVKPVLNRALPISTAALIRYTLRQTLPLCFLGLTLICSLAFAASRYRGEHRFQELIQLLPKIAGEVAFFWAAFVGAGAFFDQPSSDQGALWRRWNGSCWRFFAIKYMTGLFALLTILDAPAVGIAWYFDTWGHRGAAHWAYLGSFVSIHVAVYATTVAFSCMARGAMHSVIAALALYLLVAITLSHFGATANYEPIRMFDIQDHVSHVHLYGLYDEIELNLAVAYPIILTATSLVTVVATAVGLRAVTRRVSGITGD